MIQLLTTTIVVHNTKIKQEIRRKNAFKLLDSCVNGFKDKNGRYVLIRDINDRNKFAVLASAGGSYYEVNKLKIGYVCTCYDFVNVCSFIQGLECKHIQLINIVKDEQKKMIIRGVLKL